MIRLLVADDSALMRKMLQGVFQDEGDFDIRLARNGVEALELVRSFDPQVVTLDVQMPGMDGLTCLGQIMIEAPRPVVMISSLTEAGAVATLEAMELGAIDFVAKPSGTVSLEIDRLRPILVEKVRAAAQARIRPTLRLRERIRHQFRGAGVHAPAARPRPPRISPARRESDPPPGLVLIGTSTGGPAALDVVLPQLPAGFPWPVMVAQHMPATFTGPFARRLDRLCNLQVVEVDRPMPLRPGTIYIGKGDADLVVSQRPAGMMAISAPAQRSYPWHPSVERMVTSALEHYEAARLVGVLMTGMGRDGADAMTRLRKGGGRTIAESEASAIVWGMPGELVKSGGAELVRPLEDIAAAIVEMVEAHALR
ncbi:MAG TPA: chemotaxis-specific protein-glutamate methyltransferase CheB [Xanthobacteraceae bacterium]